MCLIEKCTTENREASSSNSLVFDDKPSDKSLIQIKKSSGPTILGKILGAKQRNKVKWDMKRRV